MYSNKPVVCFITPPSPFLLDERVFPALGILKVAAAVEELGYVVEHLDLNGVENYEDAVLTHCANTDAQVFAVTATTPQMPAAKRIRDVVSLALPYAKLIIGGPHPTLVHAAYKTTKSARAERALEQLLQDFGVVVCGDGEKAMEYALWDECASALLDADDVRGQFFINAKELDSFPLPARHLVDLASYKYEIDGVRVTPLIAQLGCPFGCNFCAGRDSAMLRRTRLRTTESVIEEVEHLFLVHGYQGFMFFDDELNVNKQVVELMHALIDLQDRYSAPFVCRGFVKAELFTEVQAEWMYKAGFRKLMCGFESGSDRILKNINKRATKDENTRAMEISHKYGLDMKALMSIGHPGESEETVRDTVDWVLKVQPKDVDFTVITPYPGSPYYDKAKFDEARGTWVFETNGDRLYMREVDYTRTADFYKGGLEDYKSYVHTDYLTPDKIVWLRGVAEEVVRGSLGIPYYKAVASTLFESSMGQLPSGIYRRSEEKDRGGAYE